MPSFNLFPLSESSDAQDILRSVPLSVPLLRVKSQSGENGSKSHFLPMKMADFAMRKATLRNAEKWEIFISSVWLVRQENSLACHRGGEVLHWGE